MSEWQSIETAPKDERGVMFVVQAFGVANGFTGSTPYTSDPVCVWHEGGEFIRWNHNFPPTHWMPLPEPPK